MLWGEHVWFTLIDPELKVGWNIRVVSSHWSKPDHSGLVAEEVVGQSSIVIYGLAHVPLCFQSHCTERSPSSVIWGRILTSLGLGSLICERGLLIVPATGASLVSWLRLAFQHRRCGSDPWLGS